MSKIFKTEGGIIDQILNSGSKKFDIFTYFDDKDYINYGNSYISLTRIDYGDAKIEVLPPSRPGQIVGGFLNNLSVQITGKTIYESIRYNNDCLSKGRAINNFTERSDFCTFSLPPFVISGATKIMTGTTSASTGVYIVDTLSSLTFTAIFDNLSGYTNSFFSGNNGIKFDLYQRSTPTNILISSSVDNPYVISATIVNPVFSTNLITSTGFLVRDNLSAYTVNYSATTFTYNLNSFEEGEYLIKGLFKWTRCTYFSNFIGAEYYEQNRSGILPYSIYDEDRDYYFIYLTKAQKPTIYSSVVGSDTLPFSVKSFVPGCDGQVEFPVNLNLISNSNLLVTVNGVVLSTDEYVFSSSTLFITGGYLLTTDVITIAYSNAENSPPIYTESYKITSIPNKTYPSVGEKIIFNTNTNKYEYWLDYETNGAPIFSINGQILSNEIDFYVSSSDRRRIILEVTPNINDIVTVFYNSVMKLGNNITTNIFTLNWNLTIRPVNNLGYFLIEITNSNDTNFTNPIYTGVTFYIKNELFYSIDIPFSGSYGDKFLARVINYKNYYTVLGELIQTVNYSDIVPLTITTNALNNY